MKTDLLDIRNCDCMDLMKEFPDKHFDLAVVDPPYGINASKPSQKPNRCVQKNGKILDVKHNTHQHRNWDNHIPTVKYFDELYRVSKNQIIWGANYFGLKGGMLIWDKLNGNSDQADCEIAFTSKHRRVERVFYMWSGMIQGVAVSKRIEDALMQQGNKKLNEQRIHPTQKPIKLYNWIFANYAKEGMKILDTHMGSGSIAISAHYNKMHLTASELDKDYYNAACERIERETRQLTLF